ncbi:MAG TPA: YfiR family protein [Polyangiaceae bacterium]
MLAASSFASSALVPADLQAELISKLAAYDRNFSARARPTAVVLIVSRPGNPRSSLGAAVMKSEFAKLERIGGLPHRENVIPFEGAAALAKRCRAEGAAIVYLTPGLEDQVAEIQKALTGLDILSVSGVPESVPEGIVLGFELVSGKPKILLNLPQAKRQNVSFKADVLKLMKVYR